MNTTLRLSFIMAVSLLSCAGAEDRFTRDGAVLERAAERPAAGQPDFRDTPAACSFEGLSLPESARVYAAGAYGGRELDQQIDDSGHQATRIDVTVNFPDAPVALMLGAYEPTVWNISWSEGSAIAAVLLSGYHRQAIAGLPESVPLINSSHHNQGPCEHFYITRNQLPRLNPIARRLFDRPIYKIYGAKGGTVTVGAPWKDGIALRTSSETAVESFFKKGEPLAGPAGLRQAEEQGILRKARQADVRRWLEAYRKHSGVDLPPVEGIDLDAQQPAYLHNAYVVLKKLSFPAGLYGAHSGQFFVPAGVPKPTGDPGHSTIYYLGSGACEGTMCRR